MTGFFAPLQSLAGQPILASIQLNTLALNAVVQNLAQLETLRGQQNDGADASIDTQIAATLPQLEQNLRELPPGIVPEHILSLLEDPQGESREHQDNLIAQVKGMLPRRDWYESRAGRSTPSVHPAASPATPKPTYVAYSYSGEGQATTQADPDNVSLSGYRVAEEFVLERALRPDSPYKLVLLSSFTGSGISGHVVPHVQARLQEQGFPSRLISFSKQQEGPGLIKREAQKKDRAAPVLIVDDTQLLSPQNHDKLARGLAIYLQGKDIPQRTALLIGGAHTLAYGVGDQGFFLGDVTRNTKGRYTASDEERLDIRIQPKPLNRHQAKEILAARASGLSVIDQYRYTDFVLARLAPYLSLLRQYTLTERVDSLKHGLSLFAFTFDDEERLSRALNHSHIYPEGGSLLTPITSALELLSGRVYGDVEEYLRQLKAN